MFGKNISSHSSSVLEKLNIYLFIYRNAHYKTIHYSGAWIKTVKQKLTSKQKNTKLQNIDIISTYYERKISKHLALKAMKGMLKIFNPEEVENFVKFIWWKVLYNEVSTEVMK